jgi:hypothetical protein
MQKVIKLDEKVSSSSQLAILNNFVSCYVYDVDKKKKFMNWWKKNKWFYKNEEKSTKRKQKIHWDFDKKTHHWKHYFEKATTIKKTFKIICKRCYVMLTHFSTNVKNTIMINHLIFAKCRKTIKFKSRKQILKEIEYKASIKKLS